MKWLFLLVLIPSYLSATEYRVPIGVIDSGVSKEIARQKYMCKNGQYNFIPHTTAEDVIGHGSNVVSAIGENIDSDIYCIMSFKIFDGNPNTIIKDLANRIMNALKMAKNKDIRFLNVSMDGNGVIQGEFELYKSMVDDGVIVSVAAGNNHANLDYKCISFPACYKKRINSNNFHVVGATFVDAKSNYGSIVEYKELGVWKDLKGTSQAAPIHLARILNKR